MAGERILIVDDEESIRNLVARLCQAEGYEPIPAENAAAAIRILDEIPIDLCMVDLKLPDADGIHVVRHVKQVAPQCEVIILTGYGNLDTAIAALRLGASDYLQKPVMDLQLIPLAISRALERQQMARRNAQLLHDLQIANAELELRRRQQLQYINYIGHALSGALHSQDIARVLAQALLESIACDGVAVLLLPGNGIAAPWAIAGTRYPTPARQQSELLIAANASLPEPKRVPVDDLQIELLPVYQHVTVDEKPWHHIACRPLSAHDDLRGVAALASHAIAPFGEEALGFFDILVNQGGIALVNAGLFARANELAACDGLTGLYNHRHFFELLEAEISRAKRHNQELAVIMIDIDRGPGVGLKTVNDLYGHQAGDELLRAIARILKSNVRCADVVARYGGDEFVILAPQTGKQEALTLAERIRKKLGQEPLTFDQYQARITVSIGAAVIRPSEGGTASSVVSMADRSLYCAKELGGNCVCMVEEGSPAIDMRQGPTTPFQPLIEGTES